MKKKPAPIAKKAKGIDLPRPMVAPQLTPEELVAVERGRQRLEEMREHYSELALRIAIAYMSHEFGVSYATMAKQLKTEPLGDMWLAVTALVRDMVMECRNAEQSEMLQHPPKVVQ